MNELILAMKLGQIEILTELSNVTKIKRNKKANNKRKENLELFFSEYVIFVLV